MEAGLEYTRKLAPPQLKAQHPQATQQVVGQGLRRKFKDKLSSLHKLIYIFLYLQNVIVFRRRFTRKLHGYASAQFSHICIFFYYTNSTARKIHPYYIIKSYKIINKNKKRIFIYSFNIFSTHLELQKPYKHLTSKSKLLC